MTFGERLNELQFSFLEKYSAYSKAAIEVGKKFATGQPVTAEDHKHREQLFDVFTAEFTKHKRLQFYVIENKISLSSEYKPIEG